MAPGQYDNPFADFLDNLPGYVNQFQRNQLELGKQQLADKRYDDAQEQQVFRNELTLINSLPESARAKAMLSSENENIQEAGRTVEEESNAFDAMLNPLEVSETDSEQLDYYNNLLNNPNVRNNQARIGQVKTKIKSINNKLLRSQVQEWYNANKDNPNAKIILQQSQYDPSGAIKNITTLKDPKKREIIADASGYKRYSDTGERAFPDVVKQPPLTAVIRGLTSALSSLDRELTFGRAGMSADEVLEKEREREALLTQIKSLTLDNQTGGLTIPPPGSTTAESTRARFPGMNQASAESTKIKIPGF
tara:strand:- start:1289 stop:2209 length:921 start_codon:yes stop_codon:yes gene_type:complete